MVFEPRMCNLPAFDSADFLRLVGKNHTLWIVGDSISGQMFDTLKCILSANPAIQLEPVDLDPTVVPFASKTKIKGFSASSVRVYWIRVYKMTSDNLSALMTRIGSQPLDIVVLNIGVRTPPPTGLGLPPSSRVPLLHLPAYSAGRGGAAGGGTGEKIPKVFIFVVGGITYSEIRACYEATKEQKNGGTGVGEMPVVIGSTSVLHPSISYDASGNKMGGAAMGCPEFIRYLMDVWTPGS
jgi:hypothetical protein